MASHSAAGHCKVMAHCSPESSLTQGRRKISLAHQPCHAHDMHGTPVGQQIMGSTWKDLSKLCHTQLRWMISITAEPGCKNCALARLEVCTLMNRPVSAMALSCVSKGVAAVNSTTRTCTAQTHQPTLSSKLLSISTDQMLAGSPWLCVLGQPRAIEMQPHGLHALPHMGLPPLVLESSGRQSHIMPATLCSCGPGSRGLSLVHQLHRDQPCSRIGAGVQLVAVHQHGPSQVSSVQTGFAYLSKALQHGDEAVLVHHPPVGGLALEGDDPGQLGAPGRGWQPCPQLSFIIHHSPCHD